MKRRWRREMERVGKEEDLEQGKRGLKRLLIRLAGPGCQAAFRSGLPSRLRCQFAGLGWSASLTVMPGDPCEIQLSPWMLQDQSV